MATSPLPPPYTPKVACLNVGMWGRVLDIINRAKFQLDRFMGFGAPGVWKSLFLIDWRYRPYTNVLHSDHRHSQRMFHIWNTSLFLNKNASIVTVVQNRARFGFFNPSEIGGRVGKVSESWTRGFHLSIEPTSDILLVQGPYASWEISIQFSGPFFMVILTPNSHS